MLLVDEVMLLERLFPKIKDIVVSTPTIGDATDERINFVHDFMSAILTARRVFEKIDKCDPKREVFKNVRKEKFQDCDEEDKKVCVMKFFGMIIHNSYVFKDNKII